MIDSTLSPLEVDVLSAFYELYRDRGFPRPDKVTVRQRANTGTGRYVDLTANELLQIDDGYIDLGGRVIEMEGIPNGIMATVAIVEGKLDQLELAVYGDDAWDGEEREWS